LATKQVIIKLILRRGNGTINCPDDIIIFYTRSNVLFTLSTANLTLTWKAYYAPRLTSMFLTSTFVVYIHCCRARLEALYLFLFLFIFFQSVLWLLSVVETGWRYTSMGRTYYIYL